jgi:pimeloyl-ACP methyl ester carboxylesterase
MPHAAIRGAGHFLQEDKGVEVAQRINEFIALHAT